MVNYTILKIEEGTHANFIGNPYIVTLQHEKDEPFEVTVFATSDEIADIPKLVQKELIKRHLDEEYRLKKREILSSLIGKTVVFWSVNP
jgi:hypothetical protein